MLLKKTDYKGFKNLFYIGIIIYFILSILIFPQRSIDAAKSALSLCANVLVPSLFVFFVLSSLLISLGFASIICRPLSHLMKPLFGVSGAGALCLVLGTISGYPLGASCVCDMYKSGALKKREAEKLLAFCNNSGPLFIIGCVGTSIYHSQKIGVMLYVIHVLSAISTGVLLGLFSRRKGKKQIHFDNISMHCTKPVGIMLKQSISQSIENILLVCAYTVMFAVIISTLKPLLTLSPLSLILCGLLEISTATQLIGNCSLPFGARIILTSSVMGFAGMSVHLQVMGIVSKTDLNTKTYFLGKALHAIIASLYTYLFIDNFLLSATSAYIYPSAAYIIDFAAAIKLSLLYIACIVIVFVVFLAIEKIYKWQESVKHKR